MKKNYLLMAILVMALTLAGCANDKNDTVSDTNVNNEVIDDKEVENDVKEEVSDKKDDEAETDLNVKVDYTTTNLENIFDAGSINYDDCVNRVIDDIEFKIPADSANFFIRADYTVLYDEKYFSKYEQIFTANNYDVYMQRKNSSTYYIVFNTETEVGVEFMHTIKNYDEKTFDSILKTFNEALEEYLNSK